MMPDHDILKSSKKNKKKKASLEDNSNSSKEEEVTPKSPINKENSHANPSSS
jgi:hypothetical protein